MHKLFIISKLIFIFLNSKQDNCIFTKQCMQIFLLALLPSDNLTDRSRVKNSY